MSLINGFIRRHKRDNWPWILFVVIVCALLMCAFPLQGIPEGYDVAQHLRFAIAHHDAMANGSWIPIWSSADNLGFGSVGIRFYPPFADLVLAVTQFFTNDWYLALLLNSFFWMFPGCIGVYFWVRDFREPMIAAAAAVLYGVLPYHLLQIYEFQLYSEFVAGAILPFCFLFATRLARNGSIPNILGLSISCSLLILTHIPSSLTGFISLFVYAVVMIDWTKPAKTICRFGIAAILTLLSTSFYLVRLVSELSWVRHNTPQFSTGFYDHQRHFFPILFNFGDWYWFLMLWQIDVAILLTIVFLLPLTIILLTRKNLSRIKKCERKLLLSVSATGLVAVFMLSIVSAPLWNILPLLEKIQFPWRFTSVATLMGAVSFAFAINFLSTYYRQYWRFIVYPATAVILAIAIFDVTQTVLMAGPLDRETFNEKVVDKLGEESCACWWPTWAQHQALENTNQINVMNRKVVVSKWEPIDREFEVEKGEPTNVRVATFYYPYWKATVNGSPVEVRPDLYGAIDIPISGEDSNVNVYFEEPFIDILGRYISVTIWLALAGVILSWFFSFVIMRFEMKSLSLRDLLIRASGTNS